MDKIEFSQLPFIVRIVTCVSMFSAWVLFAEFVIDRYGFAKHIPFYRIANVCPYEFLIAGLIGAFWVVAHRKHVRAD